jgi:hypothetical protein
MKAKQTFAEYLKEFQDVLKTRHGIELNDCTDEESVEEAYNDGETVVEFVERLATKYDLDRIDKTYF